MTEREEFEAWARSRFTEGTIGFGVKESGEYRDLYAHFMYESWQAARASQWVSVDERLPEENKNGSSDDVLLLRSGLNKHAIARVDFDMGGVFFDVRSMNNIDDATHWMYPPK